MKKPMLRRSPRPIVRSRNCSFCETNATIDYKQAGVLEKYLTERGKIVGRGKTGVCSKHQRALGRAIKHARHMALIPFVVRA